MITKFNFFEQRISEDSGMLNDILEEGVVSELICDFMRENDLKCINNIKIDDVGSFIICRDIRYKNDLTRSKLYSKQQDILTDIQRNRGLIIYKSILKQIIEKYKHKDVSKLENYLIKKDAQKFNL